ncbi:MAG: AAA family ATPase [Erysipelotrichaceae bacterium]|nr:AAA family ATPase [Erysipelotrichaceae bacterium]
MSSSRFAGIGKKTAEKIYDAYEEDAMEVLRSEPERLVEEGLLPESKLDVIKSGMAAFSSSSETVLRLIEYGLTEKKIDLLKNHYQDRLELAVAKNPFDAFYKVTGFGYQDTLLLADGMMIPNTDTRRLDACLFETIRRHCYQTGDMFVYKDKLLSSFGNVNPAEIEESLLRHKAQGRLEMEGNRVYSTGFFKDEWAIAMHLHRHQFPVDKPERKEVDQLIAHVEEKEHIRYDKKQKEAIETFFDNSLMILNGGPGTGKSTTVKGILSLIYALYPHSNVQLCAPTGRAAKRLSTLSDQKARTLHSLLRWDPSANTFHALEDGLDRDIDFLIVDEFSMVETHLFSALLEVLPPDCRILLIGDEDQLESVGPGRVFNDLIESGKLAMVSLEKLFRQSQGSGIADLAWQIRSSRPLKYENGVEFHEMPADQITDWLLKTVQSHRNLDSLQILAPKYNGPAGIHEINAAMQKLLNPFHPSKNEIHAGDFIFREGDKVLLKKNMPEQDVYNGDIGTIVEIDPSRRALLVEFDDEKEVEFVRDLNDYLSHAWCISVHKSQGSEYQHVIFICTASAGFMLKKRLIYTGISRAKKKLDILGSPSVFEEGSQSRSSFLRKTTLKERMDDIFHD